MRSSPLRHIIWTTLAAVLLAVPLYQLTRPAADRHPHVLLPGTTPNVVATTGCVMTVKCAVVPQSLLIRHDKTVLFDLSQTDTPDTTMEAELQIPVPDGYPFALTVEANWGGQSTGDQPLTITLEPDSLPASSVTRWSHGPSLIDLYSFSW